MAHPLYALLSGENSCKKNRPIELDMECQKVFQDIKDLCCCAPVLVFADFSKPFILHTDASGVGLGAVLYKEQEGKELVINYASQLVTKSESQYPAHKLKFLATKWSITAAFHDYLYRNTSTVKCENNPLIWMPWATGGLPN